MKPFYLRTIIILICCILSMSTQSSAKTVSPPFNIDSKWQQTLTAISKIQKGNLCKSKNQIAINLCIFNQLKKLSNYSLARPVITKTSPCNENPLTPHFYRVKLGFTGVYIFSYFAPKHRLWVLVRIATLRRF